MSNWLVVKDVHKAPALDMVGWFTLCPQNGPTTELLPLHQQFTSLYNETAILVAVHAEAIASSTSSTTGGKLPLTIYESVEETEPLAEEGSMQIDGQEPHDIRFRPLPYSVETDETEMIAIDYVAKGAGSAAAVAVEAPLPSPAAVENTERKGKKRADAVEVDQEKQAATKEIVNPLTTEEEDQIAGITTRLNSVRMLQSRLRLMSQFLQSLPPSYLSDPNSQASPDSIHLPHLRNIQALLTRLSLLTPVTPGSISGEAEDPLLLASQSQSNDVALSCLLSLVSQDVQSLGEMGRKFSMVEQAKAQKIKGKGGYGGGGSFGGVEEQDIRPGAAALNSLLV